MPATPGYQFYSALQAKAMAAVKDILKSPLHSLEFPAQGDFKWNWQNLNQDFNKGTYDYISALVRPGTEPGTAALSSPGSFANSYDQVLHDIAYTLSSADQATVTRAQSNASTQGQTIVSDFQTTFGPITDADIQQAQQSLGRWQVQNKLDYIINYVAGDQWSGATPPLTYQQMSQARDLRELLPKAPMSADQVITDIGVYLNLMEPANVLLSNRQNGSWTLQQLLTNTEKPTAGNGGIEVFDPNNGQRLPGFWNGYQIAASVAAITNDLQSSRSIDLSMTTSQASGGQISVSIDGQAGFSVGSWLLFDTNLGGHYDMSKVEGTSTNCSVSMSFKGYSLIPIAATAWQQANNIGWFNSEPIRQAVANWDAGTQKAKDATGFTFVTQPPFTMGSFDQGGNFGLMTSLLISNYPTITIVYRNANFSEFREHWNQHVSGNLTLFGFIKLGSFSQGAYGSSYAQGADNSTFTVSFSASPEVVSVPQNMKTAYAIGCAVNNPGVTQS